MVDAETQILGFEAPETEKINALTELENSVNTIINKFDQVMFDHYAELANDWGNEGTRKYEVTDPNAIVPMPGETLQHLANRIRNAFKAGDRLRREHLETAIEWMKANNVEDAELKGGIMGFLFDRLDGKAGLPLWYETQESARRGEGQFSMIGFNGLMNSKSWSDVGRLASGVAANVLDKMGVSPLQIKKLTGWEKGAEGKWKYELADIKSFYDDFDVCNPSEVEKIATDASASEEKRNFANAVLEVLLDHNLQQTISFKELAENNETYKELTDLYPVLEKLPIVLYYDNATNLVASTAKDASYIRLNLANYERGSIHHELQHLIQMYEGFAGGASGMDRSSNIQGNGQTVNWNQVARDLQIIIPAWAQNPHGLSLKEALNVYKGRIVGDVSGLFLSASSYERTNLVTVLRSICNLRDISRRLSSSTR